MFGITIIFGAFALLLVCVSYLSLSLNTGTLMPTPNTGNEPSQQVHTLWIANPSVQISFIVPGTGANSCYSVHVYVVMYNQKQSCYWTCFSDSTILRGVKRTNLVWCAMLTNLLYPINAFAPIANVWIFKFFIETLGMNSFTLQPLNRTSWYCSWYKLPVLLSFALAALIVVDIGICYLPLQGLDEQNSWRKNVQVKLMMN